LTVATALATDSSGNVYVAGYTYGALNGEIFNGDQDAFIAKYNSTGAIQWTKLIGTSFAERATALATDSSGNVYVAGYTYGALNGEINNGDRDAFIARYNSSGAIQWTKLLGNNSTDYVNDLAIDSFDNIYLVGSTGDNLNGELNSGGYDAYIVKYNSGGTVQWTKLLGTSSPDEANAISFDSLDNFYVAVSTFGDLNGVLNKGFLDAHVVKYNSAGIIQSTNQLGTSDYDKAFALASDSIGNIYLAGETKGSLSGNTNSGGYDAFIAKY